ncbi:hypothetical protein [Beijerinckia sp. L45]|uniref:hypothetical protein n=1 Tax=Beijerinckia sp. L45 TaxID=1641855 RepID=UPI00131DEA89|nr:hypothetical protein [Beijerinckia sp. L45]
MAAATAIVEWLLGLPHSKKISAVEGVRLSSEMRRDVKSISDQQIGDTGRTHLINSKYGKK